MKRLIAYYKANETVSYNVKETIQPISTIRSQILVEGFVLQLDRDGLEFVNPLTNETALVV